MNDVVITNLCILRNTVRLSNFKNPCVSGGGVAQQLRLFNVLLGNLSLVRDSTFSDSQHPVTASSKDTMISSHSYMKLYSYTQLWTPTNINIHIQIINHPKHKHVYTDKIKVNIQNGRLSKLMELKAVWALVLDFKQDNNKESVTEEESKRKRELWPFWRSQCYLKDL